MSYMILLIVSVRRICARKPRQPLAGIVSSALNEIELLPRARTLTLPLVLCMIYLSVIYDFADRECPQNLCLEATSARSRLKDAAIGAVDGSRAHGSSASGRAYAKPSTVACGCEGHGPLFASAVGHRRSRPTLLPLQGNVRALLCQLTEKGTTNRVARAHLGGLR